MVLFARDTDADWRTLGATEPFFGVVSLPEFKGEVSAQARDDLYVSGEHDVADLARLVQQRLGTPLNARRALDFGCGVGRMTRAMADHAEQVVGFDVSPAMLETARAQVGARATFVETLPEGPFDWINAFMVFQHIPPAKGLPLLDQLLDRLAPGGLTTLHFTIGRDETRRPAGPFGLKPRRYDGSLLHRLQYRRAPKGAVLMFDYDLSQLYERFRRHGVEMVTLVPTDHVGHHGVHLIGRRGDAQALRHMQAAPPPQGQL